MTTAKVLTCNGCGAIALQEGKRPPYPPGWLRLNVSGRPFGRSDKVNLGPVDVCRAQCAPDALAHAQITVSVSNDA